MKLWRKRRALPKIGLCESYIISELCDWLSREKRPLGDCSLVFLRHAGAGLMQALREHNARRA